MTIAFLGVFLVCILLVFFSGTISKWKHYLGIFITFLGLYGLIFRPEIANTKLNSTLGISLEKTEIKQVDKSINEKDFLLDPFQYLSNYQSIALIGKGFKPETHALVKGKNLSYFPHIIANTLLNLRYWPVLKVGQNQQLSCVINANDIYSIKIKTNGIIVDSCLVKKGINKLEFTFPVANSQRNLAEIISPYENIEIKFFAHKEKKMNILIHAENPDFELKTLASFLRKKGHTVNEKYKINQNLNTEIGTQKLSEIDLLIATKSFINSHKAKNFLLLDFENPNAVNAVLNTHFKFKSVKEKQDELYITQPYIFEKSHNYFTSMNLKWGIEKNKAYTLIKTSFPLLLSGDSLRYAQIWSPIFSISQDTIPSAFNFKAPLYESLSSNLKMNTWTYLNDSTEIYVDSAKYTYQKIDLDLAAIKNNKSNYSLQNQKKEPIFSEYAYFLIFLQGLLFLFYLSRKK